MRPDQTRLDHVLEHAAIFTSVIKITTNTCPLPTCNHPTVNTCERQMENFTENQQVMYIKMMYQRRKKQQRI